VSRAVSLRWNGHPVEARLTIGAGRAVLETEGRRVEAAVRRDGPWMELTIGARTVRAASARDARGLWASLEGRLYFFEVVHRHADARGGADASGEVLAPMTGRVVAVEARPGAVAREGDLLITIEAMKMEFKVTAPASGPILTVACAPGDRVELGQVLVRITAGEDAGDSKGGASGAGPDAQGTR
jgi:acetyl/propionyl-CoA carboxylase alpha subunit